MNKKSIVITGATSFLGSALIERFIEDGYLVFAIVRPSSKKLASFVNSFPKVKTVISELSNSELILRSIKKADIFIHFAWDGTTSSDRNNYYVQKANIDISQKMLGLAVNLGCKQFFFSGSQAEYGKKYGELETENDENLPLTEYGKAKSEFGIYGLLHNKAISFIHMRIFSIYGPGDRNSSLISSMASSFENDSSIVLGPCTQLWNFLYIDDFVDIVDKLIGINCKSCTLNIASDDTRILKKFVLETHDVFNKGSYTFSESNPNIEGLIDLNPAIERLIKTIGPYKFTKFREGIYNIKNLMEEKKNEND